MSVETLIVATVVGASAAWAIHRTIAALRPVLAPPVAPAPTPCGTGCAGCSLQTSGECSEEDDR